MLQLWLETSFQEKKPDIKMKLECQQLFFKNYNSTKISSLEALHTIKKYLDNKSSHQIQTAIPSTFLQLNHFKVLVRTKLIRTEADFPHKLTTRETRTCCQLQNVSMLPSFVSVFKTQTWHILFFISTQNFKSYFWNKELLIKCRKKS